MILRIIPQPYEKHCARCAFGILSRACGLSIEPRSNTLRRNVFEQELTDSLSLADEVVLAAVYQATNIPVDQILHPEHIVRSLESRGHSARQLPDVDAIVAHLAANLKSGDVVAILSNGGFDGIYQKLPGSASQWRRPRCRSMISSLTILLYYVLLVPIGALLGFPWTWITGDVTFLYRFSMWISASGLRAGRHSHRPFWI